MYCACFKQTAHRRQRRRGQSLHAVSDGLLRGAEAAGQVPVRLPQCALQLLEQPVAGAFPASDQ